MAISKFICGQNAARLHNFPVYQLLQPVNLKLLLLLDYIADL